MVFDLIERRYTIRIPREVATSMSDEELDGLVDEIEEALDRVLYSEKELQDHLDLHFSHKGIKIPVRVELG